MGNEPYAMRAAKRIHKEADFWDGNYDSWPLPPVLSQLVNQTEIRHTIHHLIKPTEIT